MKQVLMILSVVYLFVINGGCSKSSGGGGFDGSVVQYAPVAVIKQVTSKKVFAHILPWFETPASNGGYWGEHWTMTNQNPNNFVNAGDTQRNIASNYYPMIGPYASGDTNVIDYQLLLMKLSGIDGIFIDWYGTSTDAGQANYTQVLANTLALKSRVGKVGLKYAIVYEDQALSNYDSANTVKWGQADMEYMQSNFFNDPNYVTINGEPLLLNFGPQHIETGREWSTVFSVLSPAAPQFYTLSGHFPLAAGVVDGEFAWVESNGITDLNSFYNYDDGFTGAKISAAFAGYNSFYISGGETCPGCTWVIAPTVSEFKQTVDLALQQTNNNYIQLVTWNDYGEGTMIEPTDLTYNRPAYGSVPGFGYSLLTILQQELGVQSSLSQSSLEMVSKLYTARVANASNPANLAKLDQVYYDLVSLRLSDAQSLLAGF
jgi:hypothetical protein